MHLLVGSFEIYNGKQAEFAFLRLDAHDDVLGNGLVFHKHEMLVDHPDVQRVGHQGA